MACGGGEMTDLTEEEEQMATDLAKHLGQVSLASSSPELPSKESRVGHKFSLRELEIMQTIGESWMTVILPLQTRFV